MNILLALLIFSGLDVYFLKGSSNLLVRVVPEVEVQQLTLYYSYAGPIWDSVVVTKEGKFFETALATPPAPRVIGLYCVYEDGTVDDKYGAPYLYELKTSPKMLMPFSLTDLDVMLSQARKKILSGTHIDEAITLIDYVAEMLQVVPYVIDSPYQVQRDILQTEVNNLRAQLSK
jgi:hypothetical protein